MKSLDPKIIIVFFIKNFLSTAYILPIWFICVAIFEKVWVKDIGAIPHSVLILLLDGAGIVFFVILVLGCYFCAWLKFNNFAYEMQSNGLHLRRGTFLRRTVLIYYAEIETADVHVHPLVLRFLQLYSLRISTREFRDMKGELHKKQVLFIHGLTASEASSLRSGMLQAAHTQVRKAFFDPVSGHYK